MAPAPTKTAKTKPIELQIPIEGEPKKVYDWRLSVLERAGYGDQASRLALAGSVDLHLAVELRKGGCPVATAVEILL